MRQKAEKVVLFEFVFERIIRSKQVAADSDFKGISVVNVD
jgi:hypothetical protein